MKNKHTFIDLFSGCGGLSLGFEMAGFTGILAIDNWKDALTTYAYNRKEARTLCGDLAILDPYKIKAEYDWSGNEYLEIYPVIGYIDTYQYVSGFGYLNTGYYVFYHYGNKKAIRFQEWLSK